MGARATTRVRWALALLALLVGSLAPAPQALAGSPSAGRPVDVLTCLYGCTAGYYLAAADGGVFAFGEAPFYGSMAGQPLAAPIVGITSATTPAGSARAEWVEPVGYYLAAADGGVFAFGDAPFYGSMAGKALSAPIVAIEMTPSGEGYWLLGRDGAIYAFGDARPPLPPSTPLPAPVVDFDLTWVGGLIPTCFDPARAAEYADWGVGTLSVNSAGARLVGSSRYSFGVEVEPSPPDELAAPIVAVATTTLGQFWLAGADGGVFTFGCDPPHDGLPFHGSMGGKPLAAPVVDMVPAEAFEPIYDNYVGYYLAAADGGIFAFGEAPYFGSMGGTPLAAPVVAMATTLAL